MKYKIQQWVLLFILSCFYIPIAHADKLNIATTSPLDKLSPRSNKSDTYRYLIHKNVVETLVEINTQGQLVPVLATSWEFSFDRDELTIHLREGVQMHDGELFNCDIVLRSLLRRPDKTKDIRRELAPVLRYIDRSTCLESYVLKIEFKQPYMFAMRDFASYRIGMYRETTKNFEKILVGTGPYKMERISHDNATLVLNKEYWSKLGAIDRINIYLEAKQHKAVEGLLDGIYDMIIPIDDKGAIQKLVVSPRFETKIAEFKLYHGIGDKKWFVAMNHRSSNLKNKDYRCGLRGIFNVNNLNENIFYNKAWPMRGALGPYNDNYANINQGIYEHSEERASFIISRLSLTDRIRPVNLLIQNDSFSEQIATFLAEDAGKIDAVIDIVQYNQSRFYEEVFDRRNFDMALLNMDDIDLFMHFRFYGKEIYNFDDGKFYETIDEAISYEDGSQVAEARYKSLIEVQGVNCHHAFLFQQPIFVAATSSWVLPSLHLPTGGIRLNQIHRRFE